METPTETSMRLQIHRDLGKAGGTKSWANTDDRESRWGLPIYVKKMRKNVLDAHKWAIRRFGEERGRELIRLWNARIREKRQGS